jgi:hypothetical protein
MEYFLWFLSTTQVMSIHSEKSLITGCINIPSNMVLLRASLKSKSKGRQQTWEQWGTIDNLKEYTTHTPHVHLVVVIAICQQTFWCPIPSPRTSTNPSFKQVTRSSFQRFFFHSRKFSKLLQVIHFHTLGCWIYMNTCPKSKVKMSKVGDHWYNRRKFWFNLRRYLGGTSSYHRVAMYSV